MGGIYSYMKDTVEVVNEAENDEEKLPPGPVLKNKRLLQLDPRSPTPSIMRTPIIVDKTPRTMTSTATATPSRLEAEPSTSGFDPRSPTNEFLRTPIQPPYKSSPLASVPSEGNVTPVSGIDPRSPTNEFLRTPIQPQYRDVVDDDDETVEDIPIAGQDRPISLCYSSESGFGSTDVSPELRSRRSVSNPPNGQQVSPDSLVNGQDSNSPSDLEDLTSPASVEDGVVDRLTEVQVQDEEMSEHIPGAVEKMCLKASIVENEETPKSQPVLRCRGDPKKRLGPLQPGTVRSPLAVVHNSPHPRIVPTQQSRIPRLTKPSVLTSPSDKENCVSGMPR